MMNRLFFLSIFVILLSPVYTLANQEKSYFCNENLDTFPIRQNGRVKPLFVHAKDVLKFLTGQKKVKGYSFTQLYCLLSMKSLEMAEDIRLVTKIEHEKVKALLEFKEGQTTIALIDLIDFQKEVRLEYFKQKLNDGYKKELQKTLNKISLYDNVVSGQNWKVPSILNGEITWDMDFITFITNEFLQQKQSGHKKSILSVLEKTKSDYIRVGTDGYLLELKYFKWHLFGWAILTSLLSIFCLVIFKKTTVAYTLIGLTVILQLVGIVMRIYISGRAPITNMYETVLTSGFLALVLAIIMAATRKDKTFIFVGVIYNILTLMMISFANNMLSPSISPLVPVLRDNFWLSTHVTTVIISYAAFALSWVLANIAIIKRRFGKMDDKEYAHQSDLIYTALKYGTILLSAGVILGGVWADYSWGRFWGWDPKETWSLIVLCIYMAILHGRYTNWIPNHRFVPLVALAFLSVMMAWFGVNFILASGLHSYGFSEGGSIFLMSFFAVQFAIVFFTELSGKPGKV